MESLPPELLKWNEMKRNFFPLKKVLFNVCPWIDCSPDDSQIFVQRVEQLFGNPLYIIIICLNTLGKKKNTAFTADFLTIQKAIYRCIFPENENRAGERLQAIKKTKLCMYVLAFFFPTYMYMFSSGRL